MPLFFFIIFIAGIIELGLGFQQWINNILMDRPWYRIEGSFENPGPYGGFIAIILSFVLYVILNNRLFFSEDKNGYLFIIKITLQLLAWLNLIGILIILPLTFS